MFKLILAYQMGEYEQARLFADEVNRFKHLFWGTYWYVQFTFYDSLVQVALLNGEGEQDEQTAASYTQRIAENQQKLAEWATHPQ